MSLSHISSIKEVFSNDGAFCALKKDGTIKCWGHADFGGTTPSDISNVKMIYSSNKTFSALTNNNTIITWGKTEHGGGTTKVSKKIKKQPLLNRMYGSSTSIYNVKKNNLRQLNNYNFNNSSFNRPLKQLISKDDELFINNYSQSKLEKINSVKNLTNGEITEENLNDIGIKNDKERHIVLDKIFSNITDVSFNINPLVIGLKDKLTKNKTKVFKSKETINAKSDATSDISDNQSVYSNLSDVSDNITVNMDNNVSFKVTRTTEKGLTGKYNVEVLNGKMVVYGRYSGTLEITSFEENNWTNVVTSGLPSNYIPKSYNVSPIYYNNNLYFYSRRQSIVYAEIWKLDTTTSTWSKLNTTGTIVASYANSVILYNDCLYIFGGKRNDNIYTNETYKFDFTTNTFSHVVTSGSKPSGRYQHACCLNGTDMIISGGYSSTRKQDTFKLDLTNNTWSEISTTNSEYVSRNGHKIFMYKGKVINIGGNGGNQPYNDDVFSLDLTTNTWSKITTTGSYIGTYYSTVNLVGDNVYIFGGFKSPTYGNGLDKFYKLNLKTNSFTEISIIGNPNYDWGILSFISNSKIYYYGGHVGVNGNKLYTLNFSGGSNNSVKLGEYQDGDEIIINTHTFFFGGFGCNNLTNTANSEKNYQNIVIAGQRGNPNSACAAAYLDSNGKVHCFGKGEFSTVGKNLDSGVIKICSTSKCFIALKDDGTVVIWGIDSNILNKNLYFKHYSENQSNDLYYNYSQQLNDIIDIQTFTQYKDFCILRKKNNSFIIIGDGLSGSSSATDSLLDENGNPPITGVIFENLHQIYIGASDYYNYGFITIVGINNKGKIVTIGKTNVFDTIGKTYTTSTYKNQSAVDITSKYYGISGEILSTGSLPNYNGNFYQNYTVDNLPPVSKVFINGSFATVILNNGTAAWWGVTYVYGPRSGTYEKDDTNIVTTSVFDQLRSRKFVDGVTSTSSTALLDSSGGVILFGISDGSYFKSVHPTDIFVDSTNELKNDISANVIKMVATRYESFAFLRNDNTAILVPNVNTDLSYNLFPNSYIDSITKKGPAISTKKQTYLIPNIKDIYTGGFSGIAFITTSNKVIIWSYKKEYSIIDIGQTIGGKLENVKELFSNSNSWCALKYDNTLVCIEGGKESINNKIGFKEMMKLNGCDYNDIYFGINGIYSNGGNGKGGCVLNGDGSEKILRNVKNVFPVSSSEMYSTNNHYIYSTTNYKYQGGYIAIIDDGIKETVVYWGNSKISYKYLQANVFSTDVKDDSMSLLDISNNFIGKTSSNNILGIHDTDSFITYGNSHIMKNNKYKYPNKYNFGNSIVIKVTVQNISGNNKFVFNNDTSSYTFKEGYSYIFDTSDSSNTNYKIAVSNSPDILKNENCIQYLNPGETNSFMRYYKSNKYTYIYCETNGFTMGSLYNPTTTPSEFTAIETAFGGSTEKNIVSKYVNVPINKKLFDASLNNITMDTDSKKSAILKSLFTTLPTNSLIINKDKLGYDKSNIGLNNPLTYGIDMIVVNTTKELRGMSISGETVLSSALALNNLSFNNSLYVNMNDLSDNIILNSGDKIGAPYSSSIYNLPTVTRGIEFTIRRITDSSSDARYDISSNFGTLVVNTSASNFNTTDNTGYFVNNDKVEIEGVEIIFHENGFVSKGSKKIYTNITVTVNSDSKFLFNNSTTKPNFEYDKNYKFDVSDPSNENYKLRFSKSNATNVYNSIGYGTPGTTGAFVTFTPGNFTEQNVYVFDSSNNDLNIGSLYNPMSINNGISKVDLDSIVSQTINGGITLPNTLYSSLTGSNDQEKQIQKNLRRHQMLRTIFASNPTEKTLETSSSNLGFSSEYIKTNFKVFNTLNDTNSVNINVTTDTTNTKGFYAGLEDNTSANITLSDGVTVLKIERTGTDTNNKGIYYVSNTTDSDNLIVTATSSVNYVIDSNPAGPFKDNDTATINYMPLVFGGIGDGRNTNPALNPSPPVKTPVLSIDVSSIPIIPAWSFEWGTSGGFAGIATDGKLYKWGVSHTKYLEPGNGDGSAPSSSRITDISFCKMVGYHILYCKTNGLIGNTSAGTGVFTLNNGSNILYKNGTLINDYTTITDIIDFFTVSKGNSTSAIVLRGDGSVGFWKGDFSDPYGSQSTTNKDNYSLLGKYGKRLMDSTDSNFSKIIKVIGGPNTVLLLREDGKIAHLSFSTTDSIRKKRIIWNGPSSAVNSDYFTLENCLENDGVVKEYVGNVVDIGVYGITTNDDGYYILNDKGQFMILLYSGVFIGNYKSPHYSISYDTTSRYFKKTIKVLTFKDQYLQITEDYSAIMPGMLWTGGYNMPIINKSDPWEICINGGNHYPANVNILNGNFNTNIGGVAMYNASSKDKRTISKYYGQFILMSDGYVFPAVLFRREHQNYYPYNNSNWNCETYGIYGTYNGYPANTPSYGVDLSNVKMISVGWRSYAALLNDGRVLTWGKGYRNPSGNNSFSVSSQLTNVKKVLLNCGGGGAALKNDGSVVVWGHPQYGGSTTGAASTTGMSDATLNSGVLDIFCNWDTFTAVKSDGIIVWGKHKNSDYFNELQGKTWAINNNINKKFNSQGMEVGLWYSNVYDPNQIENVHLYDNTTAITNKVSELLSAGVSQSDINAVLYYPPYMSNLNNVYIPSSFFSSGTKDSIRKLLIDLLFLMKPAINKINHKTANFSLDTKINKSDLNIFKSNMGVVELYKYDNIENGFYCKLEDNDIINFKSIDNDLIFQLKRSGDSYILSKIEGTADISANDLGPFTSGSLKINKSIIKFQDGTYDGSDDVSQKFNCIATTNRAAAYLTNTGKVITWGSSSYGGYSHEEFYSSNSIDFLKPLYTGSTKANDWSYSISKKQTSVSTDITSDVIDIVSTYRAFAALKLDGSVVTWGHQNDGGSQIESGSNVESLLTSDVKKVYSNNYAFCALKKDGTVVCWGNQSYGGNSSTNKSGGTLKNIVKVFSHKSGFIALKSDKSIVTWGSANSKIDHETYGVNGTSHNNTTALTNLTNVLEVYAGEKDDLYCAIKTDGSLVRWGINSNVSAGMSSDLYDRLKRINTHSSAPAFVNAYSIGNGVYPVDASGGVYVFSGTSSNFTAWTAIKTDISANVTRVVGNDSVIACLRNDNKLIVFRSGSNYKSYGGDFNSSDTGVTNNAHLPPSNYIVNNNTLQNIKDVFPSRTGFAAIDTSDNVICWGWKNANYVNNIDHTKVYGGDLSGNDISKNRPVALFSNGKTWCCLKEDATAITWEGTNTNSTAVADGAKHTDATYGINSTNWGGSGAGGSIRNGSNSSNVLANVKNIIPYGEDGGSINEAGAHAGFIALLEDGSGNKSTVAWGSDYISSVNTSGRSFKFIVDKLTSHSKNQIGIFNNRGDFVSWRKTARENLHEFDFGNQEFTGVDTGFGKGITVEETYDVAAQETDASNNGVTSSTIDKFKTTKLNDVDESSTLPVESSLFSGSVVETGKTKKQIRKQRHSICKLAFANNPNRTKFKTTAASLGYGNSTTWKGKTNIMVVKVNFGKATLNIKEDNNLDNNTGFLIPIEDGQEATITNKEGTSTFKIKRDETSYPDGDGKYFIETVTNISMITNYVSDTYIKNSSPQGPFRDGDTAIIAGVPILFGGLTEDEGNYSFGDPYIKPIIGNITKLPDEKALYRLFQGLDVYINCSVDKISEKKQKFMEDWFYRKTGFDSKLFGFITSGYFYNKIYITSENHELLCDFDKQSMTMDEKDQDYFTIANTYGVEKDNKFILNEKCSIYTISWPHKEYNNIEFTIKIYENPQIDNAVSIQVAGNIIDCKGLLVRNYKPSLMKISDIKIKKDKKLNKKLKNAKHKFATKAIKDNGEVWIKVKGT